MILRLLGVFSHAVQATYISHVEKCESLYVHVHDISFTIKPSTIYNQQDINQMITLQIPHPHWVKIFHTVATHNRLFWNGWLSFR